MPNITRVRNLQELDSFLAKLPQTENWNLVNYAWLEYGFFPIFFNELFLEFFKETEGPKLGICFEGHDIFYEPWVDELIILEGFIDTSKTYVDNKETPLLIENFSKIGDRGEAFWYTLRNFDEDEYDRVVQKYKFRNVLHSLGRDRAWKYGLFNLQSYKYASGERDFYTSENTAWRTSNTLGWDLSLWKKDYHFDDIIGSEEPYACLFIKNTWKARNFRSSNIKEFLVGDGTNGTPGFGFVNLDFYNNLVNKFINEGKKLVIINDLVKFPIPESEFISEFDMRNFFDVRKFLSVVHNSEVFITPSTSPVDLASYYCTTNIVLLDDQINKNSFVSKVCEIRGKKSISCNYGTGNFESVSRFIDEAFEKSLKAQLR